MEHPVLIYRYNESVLYPQPLAIFAIVQLTSIAKVCSHNNLHTRNLPFWLNLVEACVAKRLTPQTLDLEVQGSSLTRRVVSLDNKL